MPGPLDQLPPDATSTVRRVAALERLVRELLASRRGSNATIGGGTTTITGARIQTAEDGARAVLDSTDGALKTYDADDNLTNQVGGADNVIFNQSGFPDGEWVAMCVGNLLLGIGNATDIDQAICAVIGILGVGFGVSHESPTTAAFTEKAFLSLLAGTAAGTTGTVNYPTLQIDGDLGVMGSVVKLTSTFDTTSWRNVPATWQTPTWGSGWASTNTFNGTAGFRGLQVRLTAEDEVRVVGCAVTSTGATGSIGTIPYAPPTGQRVLLPASFHTTAVVNGFVQITEAGVLNSSASLGGVAVAAGTQVCINGSFPLGNLP